ncbi:MAG TPA: hypothetical protein VKY32_07640 [Flavobacterium sp.]|nr:hypothetical protein [Flavobacterium sp.]
MKKKPYSWIVVLILLLTVAAGWIYYSQQKEHLSVDEAEKVKQMLMTSSQHINSGMESVQQIRVLEKTPTSIKNK